MPRASHAVERLFAEDALRLAARASGPAPWSAGPTAELTCAAAGLPAGARRLLAGAADRAVQELDGGRLRLRLPLGALAELAGRDPALELLRLALSQARRPPGRPRLMGILNVTPDSFSDGGRLASPEAAVERGLKLVEQGVDILDVGGASTRPGAAPVSAELELERTLPVVEGLSRATDVPVSIDTTKAAVARAALAAGARMVNDVSAGRFDEEMLPLWAETQADVVLMHMQNTPADMQRAPHYDDVTTEVCEHLRARVAACLKAGVALPRIAIDPGIGFGKRLDDNLQLMRSIPELRSLGAPVVLGVSRKSFLGALGGEQRPDARDTETAVAVALGWLAGAEIHRVHDVDGARRALAVATALGAPGTGGLEA